ncbi:MAG: polyhydroxyalkanoate depolymerase, partial [Planctomycetota bacterium]
SDDSGNHTWVEIWSEGEWHWTGAFEPTGDELNKGWFANRATKANAEEPAYAIYAVTYAPTPIHFPMVWSTGDTTVPAVNVTSRYANAVPPVPDTHFRVRFVAWNKAGERLQTQITLLNNAGEIVFTGTTKDERFDTNDHLTATLPRGTYRLKATTDFSRYDYEISEKNDGRLFVFKPTGFAPGQADISEAMRVLLGEPPEALLDFSKFPVAQRGELVDAEFASEPLTQKQAKDAVFLVVNDHRKRFAEARRADFDQRLARIGDAEMRYSYRRFGDAPKRQRSLYISLHGGGGTTAETNDRQWENQKTLYTINEGIYLTPRAPTDTWNLWHQPHVDELLDRVIADMILFEGVDPNRVYLTGYSAGGDGVYQLAPRMADRFAAAAMMAGHPNDASPLSLRNLPFAIQMGASDAAYNRNTVAAAWGEQLDALQADDAGGYTHKVDIYDGKGHWMDGEDAAAVAWMGQFTRDLRPGRIVWKQDDVTHDRFYWLKVDKPKAGSLVIA